jgi:hypothetical protein
MQYDTLFLLICVNYKYFYSANMKEISHKSNSFIYILVFILYPSFDMNNLSKSVQFCNVLNACRLRTSTTNQCILLSVEYLYWQLKPNPVKKVSVFICRLEKWTPDSHHE